MIYYSMTGCYHITVVGRATTCARTDLLGEHKEPCIEVDEAYKAPGK
jgi:hypothetical protein